MNVEQNTKLKEDLERNKKETTEVIEAAETLEKEA